MHRIALAAACAALVVGCGGNGGGGNETARDAAQAYVQARNQGDAGKVCELYSDQLIHQLHASNCEAFVKEQSAGVGTSLTLVEVNQSGDTATATLEATASGEPTGGGHVRITLQRQNGDWKITSLGGAQKGPD
jgi:ketosteroid isomerase-like protein